ncbi:MAG: M28 family peptidase [Bacteroidales bacterium]
MNIKNKKIMPQAFTWFLLMSVFSLFIFACSSYTSSKAKLKEEANVSALNLNFPDFNADSALLFVKKQLAFGPRIPNSKAQKECALYLQKHMQLYAPKVEVQEFSMPNWEGNHLKGYNIIASFNPENKNRLLLAAHWDSRPYADHDPEVKNHKTPIPGANDGASGVAVLMEVARLLAQQTPHIGVDIIFFDLEDVGTPEWANSTQEDTWCLGSQYWAQHSHTPTYTAKYGILLDMVACHNPNFTKEGTSMYYAPDIMNEIWRIAGQLGYGQAFPSQLTGAILDDHLYVNKLASIPMIDIIHYDPNSKSGFFPYWHTIKDDIEQVNPQTMEMVGELLMTVIFNQAK